MNQTMQEKNKALVLEAFDTLFNKRDYAAAEKYWSPDYIQHSAHIEPGRDGLFNLIRNTPDTLRYEHQLIVAEGDYVIVHGRFSGIGRPVAWIAADIVRIENGRLAEHWDVLQDEATKAESKSGLQMFGDKFPSGGETRMDLRSTVSLSTATGSGPREIPFNGVRLRYDSNESFDEVLSSLLADVGDKPLLINEVAAKSESWESYSKEIESRAGPSGFILFATIDHGAWIKKVDIRRKVIRLIIGNPTIAITMLRHDLTAGLFVPVELILVEEDNGRCSLTYVRPSSLMVVETNDGLLAAARQLDAKLQALATKVTSA